MVYYKRDSPEYKEITRCLAGFVGGSNTPNSIVQDAKFKSFLKAMNPAYPVPSRNYLSNEISQLFLEMKAKVQSYMEEARKINFTIDLWTKKGLTSSYIGVSSHFFSCKDNTSHYPMIAVRQIHHPTTGENIRALFEEIIAKWGMPGDKVMAVVTDNGSNVIKAFKELVMETEQYLSDDKEEELLGDTGEQEYSSDEELVGDVREEDGSHGSAFGDEDNSNFDAKFQENVLSINRDLENFDQSEIDHTTPFPSMPRLSCFAHTLQLVVLKFNTEKSVHRVMQQAYKLVSKVNKSSVATQSLIRLCGKKLIGKCPTRWSSSYLLVDQLLDVNVPLNQVLQENGMDSLRVWQWNVLEHVRDLLKPFAHTTSLSSGEVYETLPYIIPYYCRLKKHLKSVVEHISCESCGKYSTCRTEAKIPVSYGSR